MRRKLLCEGPQTPNTKRHPCWCFFVLSVCPTPYHLPSTKPHQLGCDFVFGVYDSNTGKVQHPSLSCFFLCHTTAVVQHLRHCLFFCFQATGRADPPRCVFLIFAHQGGFNTLPVRFSSNVEGLEPSPLSFLLFPTRTRRADPPCCVFLIFVHQGGFNTLPLCISFTSEQRRGFNTFTVVFSFVSNATRRFYTLRSPLLCNMYIINTI